MCGGHLSDSGGPSLKLNRRQRKAALVGLGVAALMTLFPPKDTFQMRYRLPPYRFLFSGYPFTIRINRLCLQYSLVAICTVGGIVFFMEDKTSTDDTNQPPSDS